MCVLGLSKVFMYELHYDYIKNENGNNSRLLFTNTDSFMYEIKTEDDCEDFSKDMQCLLLAVIHEIQNIIMV